jgi:hypothetical protein
MRTSRTVKVLKQTSCPSPSFKAWVHCPSGGCVEQVRLPGLGGSAGEQDECGTAGTRVIVQLQGLPQPGHGGCGMAGLA